MTDHLVSWIEAYGYIAIALLMLLENVFPPIPSELIMPFAGFAAARGDLHAVLVAIAGTCGSTAGALLWYGVGRKIGAERLRAWTARHGRWLTLSPADIDRAQAWFDERGHVAVFAGRLIPGVRTLISVPAGMARMPLPRFLAWTVAGSLLWSALLTALGFYLNDRYEAVSETFDWIVNAAIGIAVLAYLYRVATFKAG